MNGRRWLTVVLSIAAVILFAVSSWPITEYQARASSAGAVIPKAEPQPSASPAPSGYSPVPLLLNPSGAPGNPGWVSCFLSFGVIRYAGIGPGCYFPGINNGAVPINTANLIVEEKSITTTLYNYLNITNAAVANLNATMQETLSYFESRAEAIVPYFLKVPWSNVVANEIIIDSGLAAAINGVELAFANQQYQDWNATGTSWNGAFQSGGPWAASPASFAVGFASLTGPRFNQSHWAAGMVTNGHKINVSVPWELFAAPGNNESPPIAPTGPRTIYMEMEQGGTIVCAAFNGGSPSGYCSNDTVRDITQNFSFYVPQATQQQFFNYTVPIESKIHNISAFDLLAVTCNSGCTGAAKFIETSGAYVFENVSNTSALYGAQIENEQTPYVFLNGPNGSYAVPSYEAAFCITTTTNPNGSAPCRTIYVPGEGTSTGNSTTPGGVVGGPLTLTWFAPTMQHLVNNTMTLAYDYWLTLRAITDVGRYSIPSNCAIPTPSDAIPASTDLTNYMLDANDIEAVYLSYLNAVAREYGQTFTTSTLFCGSPNLGFSFNWTGSWKLHLNITASVYLANGTIPVNVNGTANTAEIYATPSTWDIRNVDPVLLYPFEYASSFPLNKIIPVPVNNPMAAVLVNYTGNVLYGQGLVPAWGVPTYLTLNGFGNYSNVNGTDSRIPSKQPVADGDAIYISSCTLNNVSINPCNISETYFNQFSFGLVHAVAPPVPSPVGAAFGLGAGACGTGAFTAWYDAWAGYVVSGVASLFVYIGQAGSSIPVVGSAWDGFWTTLGCLLGWIVLIIVVILIAWVVSKVIGVFRGRGSRPSTVRVRVTN